MILKLKSLEKITHQNSLSYIVSGPGKEYKYRRYGFPYYTESGIERKINDGCVRFTDYAKHEAIFKATKNDEEYPVLVKAKLLHPDWKNITKNRQLIFDSEMSLLDKIKPDIMVEMLPTNEGYYQPAYEKLMETIDNLKTLGAKVTHKY